MRLRAVLTAALCLLTPGVCFALAYCIDGNKPQSAANYEDWPGLVDVVNDPSRTYLCWCNGDETLWYKGDTKTLNRVLEEFAEVDVPERRVVLLPGPKPTENSEDVDAHCDWFLRLIGGIAKAHVEGDKLEAVYDIHPTLTIYVTDRIELSELQIPDGVTLVQMADLRTRYEDALSDGNERTQGYAQDLLDRLDEEADREVEDARNYQRRIAEISAFIEAHK